MKVRNNSERSVKIRCGGTENSMGIEIGPDQVAEVPDVHWDQLRERKPYKGLLESGKLEEEGSALWIIPGDGDADCNFCHGRGFVSEDGMAGRRCKCVYKRDVLVNIRRIWPGYDLMKAKVIKTSPLRAYVDQDAWITGNTETYRAHLRHVASRQGAAWFARVRTDVEMMAGWFAQAKAKAIEIYDADVREATALDLDLNDLAEPPELLIMVLGSKRARNEATPEVLMEILAIREVIGKPTWIVDQPGYCISHRAHRCHSPEVLARLEMFTRFTLRSIDGKKDYDMPQGVLDVTPQEEMQEVRHSPASSPGTRFLRRAQGSTTPDHVPHIIEEDDE